ncbi:glycosyltransferase family 4 protein [Paraburkholderia lycopersici]|uniref:Glycosyltransferase involved in cell wall bisynthesis n=1 Tax=Paraburkholderia lycopersici TaxID=416944 RepID=A0A1G6GJZ8_9BURK|nr:glycosyltransferase family 1 protein [Paraburkholderia lycopersici]SDB82270.1 Glycosyltransferase involved in cell wall bisynthesis [Paraburkholderia lycopersici]
MKTIAFNGKFFGAAPTGVHKVAEQLVAAIDALIAGQAGNGLDCALVVRDRVEIPSYRNISCVRESRWARKMHRIAWEQCYLPLARRRDFILNLCNLGPLFHRDSATMIHDAQVYSAPESYSLPFRLWYKSLYFFIGKRHRIIFTVSEFSKSELVRYGIADPDKIVVVHNGCDHVLQVQPDARQLATLRLKPRRYVLALANTQKHKNIGILLKAFAGAQLGDVELVLFGGATRADFEGHGHVVPPNVRFTGRIADAELVGLMANAGALAFPSLTEGFGLPPLEAMALGCPVVAAPCGALPEVCGKAVLYADPFDPDAWSSNILAVLNDEAVRQSLIFAGLGQAGGFTWKQAARSLFETVRAVTG